MALICEDLTVVELGAGSVAAAAAGMFLADNGARVIKIEPPTGDRLRTHSPSGWLVWNRGKESWVVDLKTPEGQETARSVIAGADVVLDGLEAGQADAWRIGYDQVKAENPGLIFYSIKGFGSRGPYAHLKGYDALVMAKAGHFNRGAFGLGDFPVFIGAPLASHGAAQMATAGIMAALIVRDRTGVGQRVEATLFQGLNPVDYFFSYHYQLVQKAAAAARERGEAPMTEAPAVAGAGATRYFVVACTSDGRWIHFATQLPHQARALMEVLELTELLADPRFKAMPSYPTPEDAAALEQIVRRRVKERSLDTWVALGLAHDDLPFEPYLTSEEALDHPQIRHNGNVVVVHDPRLGPIEQIGPVGMFCNTPSSIERSAPALDAHAKMPTKKPGPLDPVAALPAHPLAGLTIVEFGYFYAMPYGVTMAAALGARVIKIEDLSGDPMRWAFGLPEWGAAKTTEGKESIALNLRTEVGRGIAHQLIRRADVFVQGFRPGVDAKTGMDYETLHSINERLVYVHGAGYGPDGPMAHRPVYAGTANAMCGAAFRQAPQWLDPQLCAGMSVDELQALILPRMTGLGEGDASGALGVFTALMLALRHQQRTGQGQFVATSMINGNALGYADDFVRYEGKVPPALADQDQRGLAATYRLYPAASGWVFFAAPTDADWRAFVDLADRPALEAAQFGTSEGRAAGDRELTTIIEHVFSGRSAEEWERILTDAGVGCVACHGPAPTVTCTDPVLRDTGLVAEVDHPLFGPLLRYGAAASFSATPPRIAPGGLFAADTAAILAELGYSNADIEELVADGAVRLGAAQAQPTNPTLPESERDRT